MITCEPDRSSQGSYPIFEMGSDSISVQREGPGLKRLLHEIPLRLQPQAAA